MITNKEFQDKLKQFDNDLPVAIAISYNDVMSLFYELNVEGIKSGDLKVVIIASETINEEYEVLFDGGEIDEEKDYH